MTSSIAAAVVVAAGRLLLVRQDNADGPSTWSLPQVMVEDGESAEEAVIRETRRTVGLTVEVRKALCETPDATAARTTVYLACVPATGTTPPVDVAVPADHEWCGQPELLLYLPTPLVDEVQHHIDMCVG
jgi:ADP-ribose pyrophosphatase YjhB (NUDIX family)